MSRDGRGGRAALRQAPHPADGALTVFSQEVAPDRFASIQALRARAAAALGLARAPGPVYRRHMARSQNSPEFEIEVDGEPYVWRLQRRPQWSSDAANWRGMAIAVRHREGQREAVLEFPPGLRPRYVTAQLQPSQIAPDLVARAIASAILAGWAPLSRGKTVAIDVDETGG